MEIYLSAKEKKILLKQARETITAEMESRRPEYSEPISKDSNLSYHCGAFVSLYLINERVDFRRRVLRGCIGNLTANMPLIETVRVVAKEAAFGDPRFLPLKKHELDRSLIEISVISPMTFCHDPAYVKVGVHGLYIKNRGRSGVFLPQVPVEQGWNLTQYFENLCIKAGLPSLAYKALDTEIYTFTAVVFDEE